MSKKLDRVEIKFHFIDDSFRIRKFEKSKAKGGFSYHPLDHGKADHEITYHNANKDFSKPAILPKSKSNKKRVAISSEVINLWLNDLIIPIPICRITANTVMAKDYRKKKKHLNIPLTKDYNTTEIYISRKDYDFQEMKKLFPMIVGFLFPITTVDYILYGAGFGVEPIFSKMIKSNSPIYSMESSVVGDYRFFYRTYKLEGADSFKQYSKKEFRENNWIEFFDNIDYLNQLATTNVAFSLTQSKTTPSKAAYEYDLKHLSNIKYKQSFISRLESQFSKQKKYNLEFKKFRTGIVINR